MARFARMLSVAAVLCCGLFADAQITYKYATITYPGATSTTANGINNGNVIVGTWTDSKNASHGYKYQNSKFTSISHPGANNTYVNGINDYGDIVGFYTTSTEPYAHGFKLHNGTFVSINYPGVQGTDPMGINKYGEIVGGFGNSQGFIYQSGKYRVYNAPDNSVPDTVLNGVSNLGAIVGQVFSYDNWRGFLLVGSDVDFKAPRAALDNQAYGVNGRGDVVGCMDGGNGWLALNPESGETESTEVNSWKTQSVGPSGGGACPMSINYARVIVGNVSLGGGRYQGFFGVPQ